MQRFPLVALLLFFTALSSANTSAEIYKWVDENGKVHFGDAPPTSKKAQSVDLKPGNSFSNNQPNKAPTSPANQQQLMQSFQQGVSQQKAGFRTHTSNEIDRFNERLQKPQGLDKYENKDKTKIDEIKHNLRNGSNIRR